MELSEFEPGEGRTAAESGRVTLATGNKYSDVKLVENKAPTSKRDGPSYHFIR